MAVVLFSLSILCFAAWVVSHASLCLGLGRNQGVSELTRPWTWLRYLLWLPPFAVVAPYLGYRLGEVRRATAWVVSAACYLGALGAQYWLIV